MNTNNFVIDNIKSIEMWMPTPTYEKLDISYCIHAFLYCLLGSREAANQLEYYLQRRKENNEQYKKFWSNASNVKFNDDKSRYLVYKIQ